MKKKKRLIDEYKFPGVRPTDEIKGVFGDRMARVIILKRTQKKRHVDVAARPIKAIMTSRRGLYATFLAAMPGYTSNSTLGGSSAISAKP